MDARKALLGLALVALADALAAQGTVAPVRRGVLCGGERIQTLQPQPAYPELGFGDGVFLTGDKLLVAAPEGSPGSAGAIQVFDRTLGGFVFRKRLAPLAPSPSPGGAVFAQNVAVTGDLLFAGGFDDTGLFVYVFERDLGGPGEWGLSTFFPVPDLVSIDADGDVLAIGGIASIEMRERDAGGPDAWGVTATFAPPAGAPLFLAGLDVEVHGTTVASPATDDFAHTSSWNCLTYERDLGGPGQWGNSALLGDPFGVYGSIGSVSVELEGDLLLWGTSVATWLHARDVGGPSAWGMVQELPACLDPGCTLILSPQGRLLRDGRAAIAAEFYDDLPGEDLRLVVYDIDATAGLPRLAPTHEVDVGPSTASSSFWGRSIDLAGRLAVVGDPGFGGSGVQVFRLERPCPAPRAPAAVPR